MKALVIYNSQTGFTQKYAEWIAQGLKEKGNDTECLPLKKAAKKQLLNFDCIVFGSWCMAGSLVKIEWFAQKLPALKDKKTAIFACGATPVQAPEVKQFMESKLSSGVFAQTKAFYCQGGLNYNKMKLGSRMAMKALAKILSNKSGATAQEKEMAARISRNYDITEKQYADCIVEYLTR